MRNQIDEEHLKRAAYSLCRLRGLDPEKDHLFAGVSVKEWQAAAQEIRPVMEVYHAIKLTDPANADCHG